MRWSISSRCTMPRFLDVYWRFAKVCGGKTELKESCENKLTSECWEHSKVNLMIRGLTLSCWKIGFCWDETANFRNYLEWKLMVTNYHTHSWEKILDFTFLHGVLRHSLDAFLTTWKEVHIRIRRPDSTRRKKSSFSC